MATDIGTNSGSDARPPAPRHPTPGTNRGDQTMLGLGDGYGPAVRRLMAGHRLPP
ncbi:hypothetical protein EHYA_08574 [Embleya hyalina]|uniref:Uncharacterized protein n=1 Tax=Embleya hyalina TaxID=516124 RepID=A0A401Z201_9ACTN|nr:hypothetical protein EHYA_08574 [Embleya hyalina]